MRKCISVGDEGGMTVKTTFGGLFGVFQDAVKQYGNLPALEIGGGIYSYSDLYDAALALGGAIRREGEPVGVVGFLAHRTVHAYTAVLGILAAGSAYVPLHPRFPASRSARMLESARASLVVVAPEGVEALRAILPRVSRSLTVVCLESSMGHHLGPQFPQHRFVSVGQVGLDGPASVNPAQIAYLLFTSGSTGDPKGVPISHQNVLNYLEYVVPRYGPSPSDRCSQTFDLTFDLSVHDMFVAWSGGACLCTIPQSDLLAPARFIRDRRLTTWFSVPSMVTMMERMRLLKPGSFPTLRLSLFCGEALLSAQASVWQRAAPNSLLENLYGPTETTIAIANYRWIPGESESEAVNGIVPIGTPFPGHEAWLMGPDGYPVQDGSGELWLAGPQVSDGYYHDEERSKDRFVQAGDTMWYRTGDLVNRDPTGCLHFVGRLDQQVQVMGHRVELGEIEHILRRVSGADAAIALPWPPDAGRVDEVYAFLLAKDEPVVGDVRAACKEILPSYMVPAQIFWTDRLPLNVNGKVDRKALLQDLKDRLNA